MTKTVLVVVEHQQGALRQVTLEALHVATVIAGETGRVVSGVLGYEIEGVKEELASYFHHQGYCIEDERLACYVPDVFIAGVNALVKQVQPDVVVFGHTSVGRDVAPMLAADLEAGQISDIVGIEKVDDSLLFTRPIYAGKAFEKREFTSGTWVFTVRPNNFPRAPQSDATVPFTSLSLEMDSPSRFTVQESVQASSGKRDLTEANVIVSGGRGVRSADGFRPLEELAELLDGAVGASRAACDAGYCDYSLQIGQTGKVVTPDVYIACGISGAIQHLAGMSQSKMIIAINHDDEAPIFEIADYAVKGDLFEIVPRLTEELKRRLSD